MGQLNTKIECDGKMSEISFIVVKSLKTYGLLGRDIIDSHRSNIETNQSEVAYLPVINNFRASIKLIDRLR